MYRLIPLLALSLIVPSALAQHSIEAFPNPYDEAVYDTLVLRNTGTEPVTLDSLRFVSSFEYGHDGVTSWVADYTAYLGGEEFQGILNCPGAPYYPCHSYQHEGVLLEGASLAPADSIAIYRLYAYCGVCRGGGWTVDDTLLVYAGGAPEPLQVEILNGTYEVSTEGSAPALPPAVEVYPNPARGRATLRLDLPTASEIEARTYDARGRLVAGPERHVIGVGEHLVPLSLDGLSAGVYHVEVRSASRTGGAWRSHRVVVVLD